ncbi:uncharacterized protein [Amphiura filiformis]|uniref:uncharacterized protein n=1 Tax=Amphiura filiformis TaxID=82378 RepID=UPI003B227815
MSKRPKSQENLQRVYIWALPRTLGTALVKCLSYVDGIQIVYEPCVSAYHYGPEADTERKSFVAQYMENAIANQMALENAFDDEKCTYDWIKHELEADYPGKKSLLVKDIVYCLDEKYDVLPAGFRYAFLIRHPYRVLPSWKSIVGRLLPEDIDINYISMKDFHKFNNQPEAYEMQYNLFNYIKENLDPNVVVIDADDLQSNPSSILRQFCQGVGIPYDDSLLKWPGDQDIVKAWKASRINLQGNFLQNEGGFYEAALKSTHFFPARPLPDRSELPKDIQDAADYSMQFYDKMREMCLKP